MVKEKLLYSVRDIFSHCIYDCTYYNIPEYQRGYKWTSDNVKQLLEDLKDFKKSSESDFYCLQNITVTELCVDGKKFLNVIDGQQRLTTLFILLSYLRRENDSIEIPQGILKYSIRKETDKFLQEEIMSGRIWTHDIVPEQMPTKDQYYIAQVCKAIAEWNLDNEIDFNEILDDLKLIVNKVEAKEEEQIFANINGGKVDLDGADLIRAILITRAAKQKFTNESDKEKIGNFRIRLGLELDSINLWWSNEKVRAFYEQLLPNRISQNKDFKYKEYPIDLLYFAFYEAYKREFKSAEQKDIDIRVFENGLDLDGLPNNDHYEFYTTVMEFHKTMVDWFEEDEIFNLLGYLMSNFKSAKLTFSSIWEMWKDCQTKTEFINELKDEIKKQIANSFAENSEEGFKELLDCITNIEYNWYKADFTTKLLPLADILPVMFDDKKRIRRVEISDFKCSGLEDKEHLRSQTRNFEGNEELSEPEKKILEEENKHGLNSIGNIVLLHQKVNRSYGNKKLYLKIDRIISEYVLDCNAHIRPYTFDVFRSKLNNLTNDGELFWDDEDIRRTANQLSSRINDYLDIQHGKE